MKTLPQHPNLDYLRRESRALRDKHRNRDNSVCDVIGHFDTSFHGLTPSQIFDSQFSILDAQRVTARQYCFASWRRLKLFVDKSTKKTDSYNTELKKQIIERNQKRLALIKDCQESKEGTKEALNTFILKTHEMLEKIYDEYDGWIGPQVLGADGTQALFEVGLSHSLNSGFQYKSAMLMKEALPKGECLGFNYAMVMDRWLNLSYKPSIYGCFNDFNEITGRVELSNNVIDRKNLNKRRAEVGLDDFDRANQDFVGIVLSHQQQDPEYYSKEGWQESKRKWALEGGYIAA